MTTVRIEGAELSCEAPDVIEFEEGLIGLPRLRRMVLARQEGLEPLLWLVSRDDPEAAFLVIDPREVFGDYDPPPPRGWEGERCLVLSTVRVAADWRATTINLRAPVFVSPSRMRGLQCLLGDARYQHDEPLPPELLAA
jgi:flagellar assembly factor FliW